MKLLEKEKYFEVKREESEAEKSNLKGDRRNFAFLILLYVLQGVPQGISVAIPILLQNRGVSYHDQAGFSISYFPFSSKLLIFFLSFFGDHIIF
jgi:PAT family acetyl-CoA transporter-like MFS transporter 1